MTTPVKWHYLDFCTRIPILDRKSISLLLLLVTGHTAAIFESSAQSSDPVPVYQWTTLAGRASIGNEDGPAADARFNNPHGLAMDLSGNLFVADTDNHTIRKISATGQVSTYAGSTNQPGTADGIGSSARFNAPEGLAVDLNGIVYVADTGNHTIRKITTDGTVTTLAGQAGKSGTADGAASAALFDSPGRLTVDTQGNVYLWNQGVRKIASGQVTTLQIPTQAIDRDGNSVIATAGGTPAVDASGQLYLRGRVTRTDQLEPERIFKLDSAGNMTALNTSAQSIGALGWAAQGIFNDVSGNLYLTHSYPGWAGTAGYFEGRALFADGSFGAPFAQFRSASGSIASPRGFAVDLNNSSWLYTRESDSAIMDSNRSLFAGTRRTGTGSDGTGVAGRFARATSLAVDIADNIWVVDQHHIQFNLEYADSFALRKVTPNGVVSTPFIATLNDLSSNYASVTTDGAGQVYFSRYVGTSPKLTQVDSSSGKITGLASDHRTPNPFWGIILKASGPSGSLIGRSSSRKLVQRNQDGTWTLWIEGKGSSAVDVTDGPISSAVFGSLGSITSDHLGSLYVVDHWGYSSTDSTKGTAAVRKISANGIVSTLTGNLFKNTGDNVGLIGPSGLAVDRLGFIYLNYAKELGIRRISPDGEEDVMVRMVGSNGISDTDHPTDLSSIVVDSSGILYALDGEGVTLRKGELLGYAPGITAQPQSLTVNTGSNVQFSVTATATTPSPTYQWYRGGQPFTGATSSTLSFSNARTSDAGDYTVIVTNTLGSITSDVAKLSVRTNTTPSTSSGSSGSGGGGGGAPSIWFLLTLSLAALTRSISWQRQE